MIWKRAKLTKDGKQMAVDAFVGGLTCSEVASRHAVARGEVEQSIREALIGLVKLVKPEDKAATVEMSE